MSSIGDVLEMSVVRGVVCVMCLAPGGVGERIGFGLYQSCGNRGSVGRVSVFWLQWCGLGPGSEGVVLCLDYLCR